MVVRFIVPFTLRHHLRIGALLPLTLGLGASGYVIIARLGGPEAGFAFGAALRLGAT
jgi:hypothetical protein